MNHIPYGRQCIDKDDEEIVIETLYSDYLTQGPKIKEFEDLVANYHNCKYAVAFSNGTAALHGAYYVSTKFPFGKQGKILNEISRYFVSKNMSYDEYESLKEQYFEFITTPLTFVASANAGIYCGGTPKLVDIDENTLCIDIAKIEAEITGDTRVITPVSYGGYPIDIKSIKELKKVKENNICVIHDACHAIGAIYEGDGIADYADMTILSFHPVKHICTGEGGMVLTNNKDFYEKLLLFRSHGITKNSNEFLNDSEKDLGWYYEMQELGFNYRMTEIQAALGISQMNKIDRFLYKRNILAKLYEELLDIKWIKLPPSLNKDWLDNLDYENLNIKPNTLHSYHLYPIIIDKIVDRKELFNYLRENGILVQIHYIPIHLQPYYSKYNFDNNLLYVSNDVYDRIITLPMFYALEEEGIEKIICVLKKFDELNKEEKNK